MTWNLAQTMSLIKAAQHKYTHRKMIGRDPKTNRIRYRYYYAEHHGGGITSAAFEAGSAFKLTYKGRRGHFHIQRVDGDKVYVKHDGRPNAKEVELTKGELRALLKSQHETVESTKREKAQEARRKGRKKRKGTKRKKTQTPREQMTETAQQEPKTPANPQFKEANEADTPTPRGTRPKRSRELDRQIINQANDRIGTLAPRDRSVLFRAMNKLRDAQTLALYKKNQPAAYSTTNEDLYKIRRDVRDQLRELMTTTQPSAQRFTTAQLGVDPTERGAESVSDLSDEDTKEMDAEVERFRFTPEEIQNMSLDELSKIREAFGEVFIDHRNRLYETPKYQRLTQAHKDAWATVPTNEDLRTTEAWAISDEIKALKERFRERHLAPLRELIKPIDERLERLQRNKRARERRAEEKQRAQEQATRQAQREEQARKKREGQARTDQTTARRMLAQDEAREMLGLTRKYSATQPAETTQPSAQRSTTAQPPKTPRKKKRGARLTALAEKANKEISETLESVGRLHAKIDNTGLIQSVDRGETNGHYEAARAVKRALQSATDGLVSTIAAYGSERDPLKNRIIQEVLDVYQPNKTEKQAQLELRRAVAERAVKVLPQGIESLRDKPDYMKGVTAGKNQQIKERVKVLEAIITDTNEELMTITQPTTQRSTTAQAFSGMVDAIKSGSGTQAAQRAFKTELNKVIDKTESGTLTDAERAELLPLAEQLIEATTGGPRELMTAIRDQIKG